MELEEDIVVLYEGKNNDMIFKIEYVPKGSNRFFFGFVVSSAWDIQPIVWSTQLVSKNFLEAREFLRRKLM